MEKVEIKKLIEQCLNYFYESGYAKGTIDYYLNSATLLQI